MLTAVDGSPLLLLSLHSLLETAADEVAGMPETFDEFMSSKRI